MNPHPLATPILVVALVATAFAGCLAEQTSGIPTISRVHTLTLTRDTLERADGRSEDPLAALRELLATELVVRVQDEGDYTLGYTDANGVAQTRALTGATPGTPIVVSGADPIAPAVLKRGEETISVRAGINGAWWHAGDVPLGFNMTQGAKASYDVRARVTESVSLTDLDVTSEKVHVQAATFELRLPIEGTVSWELQPPDGLGSPVFVSGDVRIPSSAGDLATLDITATLDGKPGTAGAIAGVDTASASGSAKMWFRDGQPTGAQFLGSSVRADPRITMWADGAFVDLAGGEESFSCAGTSRADACQPSEIEPFQEDTPAEERVAFDPVDLPRAEDDDAREAITLMERLFSLDIQAGDKAVVIGRADTADFGASGPDSARASALFEFSIEAVGTEDVTVPAGTFQALKIVEVTRTKLEVAAVPGPNGPALREFSLDETIARTTFWLDTTTYMPLKLVAETPFDIDPILKRLVNALDPSVWEEIGGKPIDDSNWRVVALAESSYEATRITPATHFSALVGLGLAHSLTGSAGALPAFMGLGGFASSSAGLTEGLTVAPAPEFEMRPPPSLSLRAAAPAADGEASFFVDSVTPGVAWGALQVTLDGEPSWLETISEECAPPELGFSACRDGLALGYEDDVTAGDTLSLRAEAGQLLEVFDYDTGAQILILLVQ